MAVNLTATATLNTGPYMAGLKTLQSGTAALSKTQTATAAKAQTDVEKRIQANERLGTAAIASERAASAAARQTALAHERSAKSIDSVTQGLSAQRYLYGDMARMTAAAALGLAAIPTAAIAAGASWQSDFANVVRTSDPQFEQSAASVENLRRSLVDMVQTMPASWGDVTEIATLANQMGIASSETSAFTRAVAMFSATSNVSVDQTATAFGRLKSIVPDVQSDYMGLADSILKVGVNSVATEGEIINIVTQISSIAGAAGMGSKDMIGLAGALASVRVPPELSRGVITRTFGQISRATADGGSSLAGFAKIAGMSSEEFKKAWGPNGDTGGAFKSFVEGLRELGPRAEAELRGLGITSVRDVPVLLRLSMASDSEGNIGKLLDQTMRDANDAAGETQRQYTIMAQTVGAKLKVAGNNIMAFFNEVGRTSLGPLGTVLDFFNEKLADLTGSLDDAAQLFGTFDLPFTNGELLGFGTVAALAASGILALGSALLKVKQGMIGAQQLGALFAGGGRSAKNAAAGVNSVAGAYRALPGSIITSMGRAEAAAKRGFQSMNQQSRLAAKIQRDMDHTLARSQGVSPVIAPVRAKSGDDKMWVAQRAAAAQYGIAAESAAARSAAAFNRAGSAIGSAARGMGAAASFAFGPWGLAIGIAATALGAFIQDTRGASTETSDLAESLSRAGGNIKAFKDISVGGLFGYSSKPFEEGFKNLKTLQAEAAKLREAERYDTSNPGTARFAAAGNAAKATGENARLTKEYAQAVKIMDGAFEEMVNAGNGGRAAELVQKFTGNSKDLMGVLDSPEAKNMARYFDAAFEMGDVERSAATLDELARGTLPEVQAALLGIGDATNITSEELSAMEEQGVAFAALAEGAETAAASFINYADAVAQATSEAGDFDMGSFSEALQQQIDAQTNWSNNLAQAGKIGGSQFVDALVKMGADSEGPLQAIVDNFNETGGAADGAWKTWMDQIIQSTESGLATASAEVAASRDAMIMALGDTALVDALARTLSPEQFSTVSRGMQNVGQDFALQIANGITSGAYSVEQAMGLLALEGEVSINADFDVTPAMLSLQAIIALGNGSVSTMQLDALPTLAQNAIWQVVETADGATGFVQVDAESGQAINEIAYVVDTAKGTVSTMPLTADDKDAIAKVSGVQATANGTTGTVKINADASQVEGVLQGLSGRVTYSQHVIQVMEERVGHRIARGPGGGGGTTIDADGSVKEYYANGGVRENHVAQIVPAGVNRMWAEPETGGEAYIPLSPLKRKRSTAILENVANRFGMSLIRGTEMARFADGGQYNAQYMNRALTVSRPTRASYEGSPLIGSVTFANAQTEDNFREFERTFRRAIRGQQ